MNPTWGGLALALMLVVASPSSAIQLRWAGGAQDLFVIDSTRTTLILDASDLPGGLPSEWRLLCVSDSTVVNVLADFSTSGCTGEVARVDSLAPPATPFDSTARQSLARFCSASASHANVAEYTVDILGGAHAKLKVVAILPGSSTTVIESNEVLINGGVPEPFAPAILQVTTEHHSLDYSLTAVGSGLDEAATVGISGSNGDWAVPLQMVARTANQITARARLAAAVPEAVASVGSLQGAISGTSIAAEPEPAVPLLSPTAGICSAQFFEDYIVPGPGQLGFAIQPKDFAFIPGFVDASNGRYGMHVFYIRHDYRLNSPFAVPALPELDEKTIGHAWTSDFTTWHGPAAGDRPDTLAIKVRPTGFDSHHVWAPSIVKVGPVFHMFYTGVERVAPPGQPVLEHQRIGVATSTDLNLWTQEPAPVLTAADVPWALKRFPTRNYGGQQLRDPFVMKDPSVPGQWLMYFVSVDSLLSPQMAVGAAKSTDLRHWTALRKPFERTLEMVAPTDTVVESPHVFKRNGHWVMLYTVGGVQVVMQSYRSSTPADSVPTAWSGQVILRSVAEGRPTQLLYWHATEYFGGDETHFLAAYNDNAVSLEFTGISAPTNASIDSLRLGCPPQPPVADVTPARGPGDRLSLNVVTGGGVNAEWSIEYELPRAGHAVLALLDAQGRVRAEVARCVAPSGRSSMKWRPDGVDRGVIQSGLYFLRLSTEMGSTSRKVVVLR